MSHEMTRRDFVRATSAAVMADPSLRLLGQGALPVRIGLVGCGGRGTGAAENCLRSAPNVELVAMGDLFPDRLEKSRRQLSKLGDVGYRVTDARCFSGFDAYQRVLESGIDLVLLATPPGFRPLHFQAAVEAGKHVFMEKPVAVDPVGVRKVMEWGKKAKERGLGVLSGTQNRHNPRVVETIRRVHEGQIGRLTSGRALYYTGSLWSRERMPGQSDTEWQLRNWYYFDWLSGDHIVEQHIHLIDMTDWAIGARPIRAAGVGGRQVRTEPLYGNIYDHFSIDYEYPGGVHVHSICRQWANTPARVEVYLVGTKGVATLFEGKIEGEQPWRFEGNSPNPYVQEHADFISSLRAGQPLNEAQQVAESTLTAILGREAAYTGNLIAWEELLRTDLNLGPAKVEWGPLPIHPVPIPGKLR